MSKRWLGLLLVLLWIGHAGVARAADPVITATPATINAGTNIAVGANSTGSTTLATDMHADVALTLNAGGDCGQFTLTTPSSLTLEPTDNPKPTVTVKFAPTTGGSKSCTLNIKQGTTVLLTVPLTATATGIPAIGTAGGPFAFAHVDVGATSTTKTLTVSNSGTDTLNVASAQVVTTPGNYQVTANDGLTIAPNASATWTIACKPQTMGTVDDTFRILSNDPANGTVDIPLTCTGDLGKLVVDKPTINFNALAVGEHQDVLVTLTNSGNTTVDTITEAIAPMGKGYTFTALGKTSLAGGESTTTTVTFAPAQPTDGGSATLTLQGSWHGHTTTATSALDGKTIALAVPVTTVPLGDFRFDSPKSGTFEIQNNGSGDIQISPLVFTPDAGTTANEITLEVTLDGVPVDLTQTANQTLRGLKKFVVKVTATPANRAGAIGGKITVHSPLAGFVDKLVTVTGNAQAAQLQLGDVDFGKIDLLDPATSLSASIKNTGNANLDLSAFTSSTPGPFTFTLPTTPQQLAPGMTLPINITYKPTTAHPPDNPDKITITADIAGVPGMTKTVLTIQGRGIGRQLVLPQSPIAPTTFRNPGTLAPVIPVTISNSGEATLHISAAMATGGPVWELIDGGSVDVPGATSHDFMIRFKPDAIGVAPAGTLQLTSIDNTGASVDASIPLTGTVEARNVAFSSDQIIDPTAPMPIIDVGVAGVNLPITADDLIDVINRDPGNHFTIHQITLDSADAFTIENAPKDQALAASATQSYSVTFSPNQAGDFTAIATLYLDQDPVPHAQVMLKGRADFVEAHGGGGCNTSNTSTGGGSLVLGLAALGLIRRRRQVVAS